MPRPKHEFLWNHIERIQGPNGEVLQCTFCKKTFSASTSVSRIRSHLTGKEKEGISLCDKVPDRIREEVKRQVGDKRQKTIPSSGNIGTSAFPEIPNREVQNGIGNGIQGREHQMEEDNNFPMPPAEEENNMGSIGGGLNQSLISGGVCGGSESEVHTTELLRMLSTPVQDLMPPAEEENNMGSIGGGLNQSLTSGGVCGGSEPEVHRTEGVTMITSTPVGYRFQQLMKYVWSWLMNENVLSIGIYGMGGVGKTELAKHINNRLLKKSNSFHHVFWVGVPLEFSVTKLQSSIAEAMGFSFSSVEDENKRAANLWQTLTEKGKSVLILDNLWNDIDVKRIGIPLEANGCKLVLTSRSSKVCRMTDCQKTIKMASLWKDSEAWELFEKNLGHLLEMTSEVKLIAESIVSQCEGLPLGIITIAKSMRHVNDIRKWRSMLEDLKASRPRQDISEIFKSLVLSFNGLNDSILQQCFLNCTGLYVKKYEPGREKWVESLITQGINEETESGQQEFGKAYSMLQELSDASLLDASSGIIPELEYTMHNLNRLMAFQIIKERGKVLVEFGNKEFKELPSVERWTNDLTRVLFDDTGIESISFDDHPPNCPNLTVMLLRSNYDLKFIHDQFFQHLHGLQVLDLSHTTIQRLPNSVSDLVNLTSLLLRGCWSLEVIPYLGKLRRLKKLDMSYSGIKELPEGMVFLHYLNYLNLYRSHIRELPNGLLAKFSGLQFLKFNKFINGKELVTLRKLENLVCCFNDITNFNTYTESTNKCSNYRLSVGSQKEVTLVIGIDRTVKLMYCNLVNEGRDAIYLPSNIQNLEVESCYGRTLCLKNESGLEGLFVRACNEMEYLTCSSSSNISRVPLLPPNASFSHLKEISITDCPRLKSLFPSALIPMLQNLEEISVQNCELMEEIVQIEQEGDVSSISCEVIILPKLKILELRYLPQLKSICSGSLVCCSLKSFVMYGCGQLSRISLSLPIQSLKRVALHSGIWWNRLCSLDPNAKALHQPWNHIGFGFRF